MTLTDEGLAAIPGFASRWVRLPSGAKCRSMTAGDDGPAVVLLHGGLPDSSGLAGRRWMAPFLAANGFGVDCPDMLWFRDGKVSRATADAAGVSTRRPELTNLVEQA